MLFKGKNRGAKKVLCDIWSSSFYDKISSVLCLLCRVDMFLKLVSKKNVCSLSSDFEISIHQFGINSLLFQALAQSAIKNSLANAAHFIYFVFFNYQQNATEPKVKIEKKNRTCYVLTPIEMVQAGSARRNSFFR